MIQEKSNLSSEGAWFIKKKRRTPRLWTFPSLGNSAFSRLMCCTCWLWHSSAYVIFPPNMMWKRRWVQDLWWGKIKNRVSVYQSNTIGVQLPNVRNWFAKYQNIGYQKNRERFMLHPWICYFLWILKYFYNFWNYIRFLVLIRVRLFVAWRTINDEANS